MRYLLLALLVPALSIPAFAKEIEIPTMYANTGTSSLIGLSPVFGGKGEIELYWDDGSTTYSYDVYYPPYATTFTAPADCHLVSYRLYWYNGNNINVDALLFEDDGGGEPHTPTGTTLFTVTGNSGSTNLDWFEIDVLDAGAAVSNGEIFHPGISWSQTGAFGILKDSPVPDSFSFWRTSGGWEDRSTHATLMLRVVVNDDTDGPYADGQDPAPGEYNVEPDTDIIFHVKDADAGVDIDTINEDSIYVDASYPTKQSKQITGTVTIEGTPDDYTVTFDPDNDFGDDAYVDVAISYPEAITDLLGNEMPYVYWDFVVGDGAIKSSSLGEIKAKFK